MGDMSMDRIAFLLNANREAGRKLKEQLQCQERDKAKAQQTRRDEIAATQHKHAEETGDVVGGAVAVRPIE
jgi:hypothetical protein